MDKIRFLGLIIPLLVIFIFFSLSLVSIGTTIEENIRNEVSSERISQGEKVTLVKTKIKNDFFLPQRYTIPKYQACLYPLPDNITQNTRSYSEGKNCTVVEDTEEGYIVEVPGNTKAWIIQKQKNNFWGGGYPARDIEEAKLENAQVRLIELPKYKDEYDNLWILECKDLTEKEIKSGIKVEVV